MRYPNVCFILIDALRAKNLSCYGYGKSTSPTIDSLAKDGTIFTNCYSCTNTTDPSLTSIFTGKYPLNHGLIMHGERVKKEDVIMLNSQTFLSEILKNNLYSTLAIDWLGRWHKNGFEYYSGPLTEKTAIIRIVTALGFMLKIDKLIYLINKYFPIFNFFIAKKQSDNAKLVTDHALKLLEIYKNRRFFLFIHYWDLHIPYDPPKKYFQIFQNEEYKSEVEKIEDILSNISNYRWKNHMYKWTRDAKNVKELLARYDAEIRYVDSEIGMLIEKLRQLELLDDTLIIITSDHGESLTEHGIYFDHHGLYDVNIHVPLIIRYPKKVPRGKRISAMVQHVDLVPTLLDSVGIEYRNDAFDGTSLASLFEGNKKDFRPFIFAEEAYVQRKLVIRTERYKYIFAQSKEQATCRYCGKIHGGVEELYDLKSDPEEKVNIINERPEIKSRLHRELSDFISGLKTKNRKKQALKQKIRKLKALGRI